VAVKTVDFKEIENPEDFEFFARDFLAALGFIVVQAPDRGSEEGRDLLIREPGSITGRPITWLVSCKHFAHSGRAVGVGDEADPRGRVDGRADAFMGFYSTPPSSALVRVFERVSEKRGFKYHIYDPALIEHELVVRTVMEVLVQRYFPAAHRRLTVQREPSRIRVLTEAGFSLYEKDIAFELESILLRADDALTIADPEVEAAVTACHVARQLRLNTYSVLHGIASFNPLVWRLLLVLLRAGPLDHAQLSKAVLDASDALKARLLISLAGELRSANCCESICKQVLFEGSRHTAYLRHLRIMVTPFFDVAKWALGRLPADTASTIGRYAEKAKTHKRWTERKVFNAALRLQARGAGGLANNELRLTRATQATDPRR
jgi:hypothetical protein